MSSLVEAPWTQVTAAEAIDDHRLRIATTEGAHWTIDLGPLIERRDAYWRLRQPHYFRRVGIDPLGALCWPEGEDLAPESLEKYRCD